MRTLIVLAARLVTGLALARLTAGRPQETRPVQVEPSPEAPAAVKKASYELILSGTAEAGLPNFEVVGWFGLYAPPKFPPALAARYAEAARKAMGSDDLKVLWTEHGYDRWPGSAETMAAQAGRERAMWATVAKGINVE